MHRRAPHRSVRGCRTSNARRRPTNPRRAQRKWRSYRLRIGWPLPRAARRRSATPRKTPGCLPPLARSRGSAAASCDRWSCGGAHAAAAVPRQARFSRIHKAYSARLRAVLDRAKAEGVVRGPLASKDAATMFLSLIQGLGFQFAIARLPIALIPEAERALAMYLQAITAAADAAERAHAIVDATKRGFIRRRVASGGRAT